jgi:hypothetical protein
MKRSGIKRGTSQLARSGFKARKLGDIRNVAQGGKGTAKRLTAPKNGISKGYQIPQWFRSIPLGSHGNSPTQKRYWKVISDFVRQRDFNKYKGRCVSCGKRLEQWQDGQGAHYRRYATCNSYFKFHPDNVALSCAYCNQNEDGVIGHAFAEELKRRYGEKHLDWIEKENNKWRGVKLEDHIMVERVEKLLEENPWFVLP